MNIGEKIKELRLKNKKTQADVALFLKVTPQTIYKFEKNINEPDIETIKKLSTYFNVSVEELIGVKKEEKHQIAFFNGVENLSDADRLAVQSIIDSLNNKNK